MFEVHEITDRNKLIRVTNDFGVPYQEGCRGFILIEENKEIGVGVIALNRAVVELLGVVVDSSRPRSYWDLLNRAVLNVVKNFDAPIKVHVANEDPYYLSLGFKKSDVGYEVMSPDIDLSGECKKH